MYETIKNDIRQSWTANAVVPFLQWQLTGNDGGAVVMPLFYDLQQITVLFCNEPGEPPFIQDQYIDLCQADQQFGIGAIAFRNGQLLGVRQKLKYEDVQNICLWFLSPRRAHSELCNQSGDEKNGQKGKRDWYFNQCITPYQDVGCPAGTVALPRMA